MYTSKLFESYNKELNESKKLTEKINKDNIEINKAIANPNAGKNREKIHKAGYTLSVGDDDKVYGIRNPKTNKFIMPSEFSKDKKGKVDFKGMLDKPDSGIDVTRRYDSDVKDNKKAVTDREDAKNMANFRRKDLDYYEKKVKDAQKDLDRTKERISNYEKDSDNAEARRKAIIDNIRKRKTESEHLNESVDFEDMLRELYNSYKQDGMEDNFWSDLMNCIDNLEYLNQWYSSLNESAKTKLKEEYSDRLGGEPSDFISDVESIKQTLASINTSKFGSHLAEEIVEEFIETCNNQINMVKSRYNLNESEKLEESTAYNTKSKKEFENIEAFKDAVNDDIDTIVNNLEDLKPKMNTDDAVETLETSKAMINSTLLDRAYN